MSSYTINELVLDSPVVGTHANDELIASGNTLTVKRGAVIIATRTIVQRRPVTPGLIPSNRLLTSVFLVERNPMASGVMATMTGFNLNATTNVRTYFFSDGSSFEFASLESALTSLLSEGGLNGIDIDPNQAKRACMLRACRLEQGGASPENFVGGNCAIDFAASNPILLGEPV